MRGIARAEFIDGAPRRSMQRKPREINTPSQSPQHIDLRIVRKVDKNDQNYRPQWNNLVDDLGDRSHRLGRCLAYGSLAVTYVGATEMGQMIAERYPRDYGSYKRRPKLFNTINENIQDFIRTQGQYEYEKGQQKIAQVWDARHNFQFISELENEDFSDEDVWLKSGDDFADVTEKIQEVEAVLPYGAARLAVKGIDLYKRRQDKPHGRYGLDLSLNDGLYHERQGILSYLGGVERLNTELVTSDWQPHATIFEPHAHLLSVAPRHEEPIPSYIVMHAPRTEMYVAK